jgi:hypothetical protein
MRARSLVISDDAGILPDEPRLEELFPNCSPAERPVYLANKHDTLPTYATILAAHVRLRTSRSLRDAIDIREQERLRIHQIQERRQKEADSYGVSVEELAYVPGSSEYVPPGQRQEDVIAQSDESEEGQIRSFDTEQGRGISDAVGIGRVVPQSPTMTSDSVASPVLNARWPRAQSEASSQSEPWLF